MPGTSVAASACRGTDGVPGGTSSPMPSRCPARSTSTRPERRYPDVRESAAVGTVGTCSAGAHADAVISGLRDASMFALAVGVYRRHRRDGGGRCQSCGGAVCRLREHAAAIIEAAGVKPADVETSARPMPAWRNRSPSRSSHREPLNHIRRNSVRPRPCPASRRQIHGPGSGSAPGRRERPHI